MAKKTKKTICLQGKSNSGKSYTIIKLWETILAKYKNNSDDDYVQLFVDADNYDFVGVITSVAGHKIGINSRGDDSRWIERWNRKLAENNCNIIFCVCRQNENCENAVNALSQKGIRCTLFQKKLLKVKKLRMKLIKCRQKR